MIKQTKTTKIAMGVTVAFALMLLVGVNAEIAQSAFADNVIKQGSSQTANGNGNTQNNVQKAKIEDNDKCGVGGDNSIFQDNDQTANGNGNTQNSKQQALIEDNDECESDDDGCDDGCGGGCDDGCGGGCDDGCGGGTVDDGDDNTIEQDNDQTANGNGNTQNNEQDAWIEDNDFFD